VLYHIILFTVPCRVWHLILCDLLSLSLSSCSNFLYASPAHCSLPFHALQSRSQFFVKCWRPLKWRRVQQINGYTQVNASHKLQDHYFTLAKKKVFKQSYECRKSCMKRKTEENPFAWHWDCSNGLVPDCVGRMQVDSFAALYRMDGSVDSNISIIKDTKS